MGEELRRRVRQAAKYKRLLSVIDRKCDARIVDGMVKFARLTKADLHDQMKLAKAAAAAARDFERLVPELSDVVLKIEPDSEHGGFKIVAPATGTGVRRPTTIDFELMNSPEFTELQSLFGELAAAIGTGPYALEHGQETSEFDRIQELGDRVHEIGKKGLAINRYKGLGEMNPEQLWETTMDPARPHAASGTHRRRPTRPTVCFRR